MIGNIGSLQQIYDKVTELNRNNNLLKAKYENDAKYARTHKRILERVGTQNFVSFQSSRESEICETLLDIKKQTDETVLMNNKILNNESYFEQLLMKMVIDSFMKSKINLEPDSAKYINNLLVKEYVNEYQGVYQ
jgi:type I restriction enzyme R subunit